MSTTTAAYPYGGSVNPARRAKQLAAQSPDEVLLDSDSDAGQDSDQDSDFHPGTVVVSGRPPSTRGRSSSINQPSTSLGNVPITGRSSYSNNVPILPKKVPANSGQPEINVNVPAPSRRGRKPSGLSRSAREAQRKLNHSIIEKARRTKINEALATLRELVPADYGRTRDDEDDIERADEQGKKGSKKGKKEEKEREFKLEILVRTVSFMKDLLERVHVLETAQQGIHVLGDGPFADRNEGKKRKRSIEESDDDRQSGHENRRPRKRHTESHRPPAPGDGHSVRHNLSELLNNGPSGSKELGGYHDSHSDAGEQSQLDHMSYTTRPRRLPSISSWLNTVTTPMASPGLMPVSPNDHPTPDADIDPSLRSTFPSLGSEEYSNKSNAESDPKQRSVTNVTAHTSYPSPPPSTRFHPLTHRVGSSSENDVPAALSLGEAYNIDALRSSTKTQGDPSTSPVLVNTGAPRTPDEDSAASMLLEIGASLSPPTLAIPMPPRVRSTTSAERLSLSPPTLRLGAPGVGSQKNHPVGQVARIRNTADGVPYHESPRLSPSSPPEGTLAQMPTSYTVRDNSHPQSERVVARPALRVRTLENVREANNQESGALTPQTPSSLLGMGGVERVMSRLGLGAREVTE